MRAGAWHDPSLGEVTFRDYVETDWLPSKHIETSTLAAYRLLPQQALLPVLRQRPLHQIPPSQVQDWVTKAAADGLSPRSIRQVPHHAALDLRASRPRPSLILPTPATTPSCPRSSHARPAP